MNASGGALTLARWLTQPSALRPAQEAQPAFMMDRGPTSARLSGLAVVLPGAGLAQARARLAAGARQVLFADAARQDPALLRAALAEFGADRVGAWVPVRRMPVSWAMDTQSNGDFKCMVPSNPQARWEVLGGDLHGTGGDAARWIEQLARMGVGTVLVSAHMQDERDLDLCAGLVEDFGERLWFSPLKAAEADLAAWVEFGRVRRLVLADDAAGQAQARHLRARFGSTRAPAEVMA